MTSLPQQKVTTTCNACGGALSVRYAEVLDPQTRETFAVEACESCGLGQTSPQPADLGHYYGEEYHGGRHGLSLDYCMWRRRRFVNQVFSGPPARVLDVGCGDGDFLLTMKQRGWETFGTEMKPKVARDRGLTVTESVEEARQYGPFPLVCLWHSLEHMRDPAKVLGEAASVLAPGGTLMVAVPDAQGTQAQLFGARWFHLDVPRHLFHFGERSLKTLLSKCGLEAIKTWHQELEIDLFGWTQSALNSVLPDPNVFFYKLTGRPTSAGPLQVVGSFALGSALTAAAFPAVGVGTALGKGGTLVMAAQRRA